MALLRTTAIRPFAGESVSDGKPERWRLSLRASVNRTPTEMPENRVFWGKETEALPQSFYCTFTAIRRKCLIMNGAGEGNRTLVSGLGSPHSTIEPHPHRENELEKSNRRGSRTQRWSWSGARWRTASDGSHPARAQAPASQPKPLNVN